MSWFFCFSYFITICSGNVDNFLSCITTFTGINFDSFIYCDINIFNISHTNILSSSDHFYLFSFYFSKCSFFIYSVLNIFYVNNITNIFDNNLYITGLLNGNNKFLYCNCKVTGESITLFQQEKFKVYKIFITLENNSVFLITIFIIFRFFSRKQNKCPGLCYFSVFWFLIVSLKFQINDGFHFNFSVLQKCPKSGFFNLETLTSCCQTQHKTLHKIFVFLAVTNLKNKNYTNFYKFLLLLSGDVTLNPGPIQRSPDISSTIREPLNKKGLHFLHININSLLSKKDEIRCIANKIKAAIIGITESKLDHTVPN